jgi:hypothetical protein
MTFVRKTMASPLAKQNFLLIQAFRLRNGPITAPRNRMFFQRSQNPAVSAA